MAVKALSEIKEESGRNLDALVDDNTLVAGERSSTFGVFKFFQGIKNFFKGITALGTLTSTSRIPVTDSNGNVSYTTMSNLNSFIESNAKFNKVTRYSTENVNADNLGTEGIYIFNAGYSGTATGLPTWNKSGGANLTVKAISGDGTYAYQKFIPYGSKVEYIRYKQYTTSGIAWSEWEKLVTETSSGTKNTTETNYNYSVKNGLCSLDIYLNVSSQKTTLVEWGKIPKPKDGNVIFKVTDSSGNQYNMYVIASSGSIQNGVVLPIGRYNGFCCYSTNE